MRKSKCTVEVENSRLLFFVRVQCATLFSCQRHTIHLIHKQLLLLLKSFLLLSFFPLFITFITMIFLTWICRLRVIRNSNCEQKGFFRLYRPFTVNRLCICHLFRKFFGFNFILLPLPFLFTILSLLLNLFWCFLYHCLNLVWCTSI